MEVILLFVGLAVAIVAGGALLASKRAAEKQRLEKERLVAKYGEEDAKRIIENEVWIGMTGEQVIESCGPPHAHDQKKLKTVDRVVFKWRAEGLRRIAFQVTVDDGVVTQISDRR